MNSAYDFKSKVHVKRESHELEKEDGAYVSKPGTNACIASNHKSLHVCFFGSLQKEILAHSNKIMDEERIIELILEQQEEKIMVFKPCHCTHIYNCFSRPKKSFLIIQKFLSTFPVYLVGNVNDQCILFKYFFILTHIYNLFFTTQKVFFNGGLVF